MVGLSVGKQEMDLPDGYAPARYGTSGRTAGIRIFQNDLFQTFSYNRYTTKSQRQPFHIAIVDNFDDSRLLICNGVEKPCRTRFLEPSGSWRSYPKREGPPSGCHASLPTSSPRMQQVEPSRVSEFQVRHASSSAANGFADSIVTVCVSPFGKSKSLSSNQQCSGKSK